MELVTSSEGVTNTSLSPEQVADEIDTLRIRMAAELDGRSLFRRPYQGFTQTIKSLSVLKDSNRVSYLDIPRLAIQLNGEPACLYIGGKDDKSPYRLVTGNLENYVHDHFIGKMPIAHYQEGRITFRNVAPQQTLHTSHSNSCHHLLAWQPSSFQMFLWKKPEELEQSLPD